MRVRSPTRFHAHWTVLWFCDENGKIMGPLNHVTTRLLFLSITYNHKCIHRNYKCTIYKLCESHRTSFIIMVMRCLWFSVWWNDKNDWLCTCVSGARVWVCIVCACSYFQKKISNHIARHFCFLPFLLVQLCVSVVFCFGFRRSLRDFHFSLTVGIFCFQFWFHYISDSILCSITRLKPHS